MKVFATKAGLYPEKHMSRVYSLEKGENEIDDRTARRLIQDNPESLTGDPKSLASIENQERAEERDIAGLAIDPDLDSAFE